ncbi:MAG: M60 family metallopeptidase [Rikenellaceae bacterium]
MKKITFLSLLLTLSCSLFAHNTQLDVKATVSQRGGAIMLNGYGTIVYELTNTSDKTIHVHGVESSWNAGGQSYNGWNQHQDMTLAANETKKFDTIVWMSPQTEEMAGGATPFVSGEVRYEIEGSKAAAPYKVDVVIASLPSPMKIIKGKYIGIELQESTWAEVDHDKKIVKYVDQTYKWMQDLTSNTPYNGDLMILLEAPENPYYAYAGNPIVMNTKFVAKAAATFDNDLVEFGWVHEMGHDFDDVIGNWYNWGTFTEFQANIKLSYVVEMMCKPKSKIKINSWVDKKTPMDGVEFNDEFFVPYSKAYLASDKAWTEMISDDYHSLFMAVIREQGWGVLKDFYATFGELSKRADNYPHGMDRVELALSVFDKCAGGDLSELYAQYRIPLDKAKMSKILQKYNIE